MNDGDLLLQTILERPDDDTARKVYADWLDEQPDQPSKDKAEFIRLSLQLEEMETGLERTAIRQRAHLLWHNNVTASKWPEYSLVLTPGDLNKVQIDGEVKFGHQVNCRIRRGFPYWVKFETSKFLNEATHWFRQFPISAVYLTDRQPLRTGGATFRWQSSTSIDHPCAVPPALFAMISYPKRPNETGTFELTDITSCEEEAREVLMVACLRYGRREAGLSYRAKDCRLYA